MVEHFAQIPLPPETIVDGSIMVPSKVTEALRDLLAGRKLKSRQCAFSIAGNAVIIKKVTTPQMAPKELEASIQVEAEQHIPYDLADVFLDVKTLAGRPPADGQMDVVLVAAKKDFVNEYTSVLLEAGLEPMICDVDAFAIETMFQNNYQIPKDGSVALVSVGASKTNINILSGGDSVFTRDLQTGGATFTGEIQKQLQVPFSEAEELKIRYAPGGSRQARQEALERCILSSLDALTVDIQRSFDFHTGTSAEAPPQTLFLCGGSARLAPLARALHARLGISVEIIDAFRNLDSGKLARADLDAAGAQAAVVVGLAMRYVGDA